MIYICRTMEGKIDRVYVTHRELSKKKYFLEYYRKLLHRPYLATFQISLIVNPSEATITT